LSGVNNKAAYVPIHLSVLTGALGGRSSRNPSSCFMRSFIQAKPTPPGTKPSFEDRCRIQTIPRPRLLVELYPGTF
jgi:hypothetical protein